MPRPSAASRGKLTVEAEEVQDSKYTITMQLSAAKVDKKDFFGKVSCAMLRVCVDCTNRSY